MQFRKVYDLEKLVALKSSYIVEVFFFLFDFFSMCFPWDSNVYL